MGRVCRLTVNTSPLAAMAVPPPLASRPAASSSSSRVPSHMPPPLSSRPSSRPLLSLSSKAAPPAPGFDTFASRSTSRASHITHTSAPVADPMVLDVPMSPSASGALSISDEGEAPPSPEAEVISTPPASASVRGGPLPPGRPLHQSKKLPAHLLSKKTLVDKKTVVLKLLARLATGSSCCRHEEFLCALSALPISALTANLYFPVALALPVLHPSPRFP